VTLAVMAPLSAHAAGDHVTPNFERAIPNIPGKSLVAVVVDYPPGAASIPHTYAKSAFIYAYVVSGEIESKVKDGPTRIYKAGESWSEPPGARHSISRKCEQDETSAAARGLRRRYRRQEPDHAHQLMPQGRGN
jgi:quercetin dioxygenase-like cupin family protein